MRRLRKGPKPPILILHEEEWTTAYVSAYGTPLEKSREKWRHEQIRHGLREEARGRCAYCEALIEDVSFINVDHLIPKSLRPDLAHRWDNLTGACTRCNVAKGSFYDERDGLLNPYQDEVGEHLRFFGDFVDWVPASTRGEVTVRHLKLNRLELTRARLARLDAIRNLVNSWEVATGARRRILEDAVRLDAAEGEFTATVAAYLQARGFPFCDSGPASALA